jgi:hypothetical protein
MDEAEMEQWLKRPRPETAAMTGKQRKCLQDLQLCCHAGDHEVNSWV